jgi:hypothetical protein
MPSTITALTSWNIRQSAVPSVLLFRRPWDTEVQEISVEDTDAGLVLLRALEALDARFEEWVVGIRPGPSEDGSSTLWAQIPGERLVYARTAAELEHKMVDALAPLSL